MTAEHRFIDTLAGSIDELAPYQLFGRVTKILGMLVEVGGIERELSIGDRCILTPKGAEQIPCEVVGFREGHALVMPFKPLDRVGLGCRAEVAAAQPAVYPSPSWLGRVINAMGEPIDGKGPLLQGDEHMLLRNKAPSAHDRKRLGEKLDLGVRAINSFLSTCSGQRMGIFAGSGVGKSVLMSMLARYTAAEVSVIGLIGERGREVQEFLEDDLGPEGLKKSVVIVSTSDESPLMRRQGAYMTVAVAEYFRDQGKQVLCLMDSVTRFAMAQREIGLSAGEPPTSKGYPPTTFSELARLLERAGPGVRGSGDITGFFSVLVEGDDHNEPIADAVRGIIDGHIVLERGIADRGRYPAINILRSVSRSMPRCLTAEQAQLVQRGREIMSTYEDMAELIRLGAYRRGADPKVDEAIELYPAIEKFLSQKPQERTSLDEAYAMLAQALRDMPQA
ncbi:MAG: flagellar protein export ATPase FliI [Bdellovibrionales bacterium]|jgi:flagellum-specific ATP synthase|nr:flagellar protein export ATPase FliI [Bdellovibrionales bacterium]